jgi:uncharacterized delta-60 repeat protein
MFPPVTTRSLVFRLRADWVPDTTFGAGGVVLDAPDLGQVPLGFLDGASIVLDDAGRAVIAGPRDGNLVVVRLQPNGEVDPTFGAAGSFTWGASTSRPHIVRVPGGYRVALYGQAPNSGDLVYECWIVALTNDGALDTTFGDAGYVGLRAHVGGNAVCGDLAAQPDGRLVVAGMLEARGFALRLLAGGEHDVGFSAPGVADAMTVATALAVAPDGSVLVAGNGAQGVVSAFVVRLHPDGALDTSFGNAGTVRLDMPSSSTPPSPWDTLILRDLLPLANGGVVIVGGNGSGESATRLPIAGRPFVARLLGPGETSPGLIGMEASEVYVPAGPGEAVVTVHRKGGSAGAVSVAYTTQSYINPDYSAAAGQDYVATSGRLTWSDGESASKQIVVQLLAGEFGYSEDSEFLEVRLADAQGGSGLGAASTLVLIASHIGAPGGVVQLDSTSLNVLEAQGGISVTVRRDSRVDGATSVMLTASAGTATADSDYRFDSTTVHWADGDSSTRTVTIPITDDDRPEGSEAFTVRIAGATNGAVIGTQSVATITIDDDDEASNSSGGGGGGGGLFGIDSLLLLGLAGAVRAARRRWSRNRGYS